MNPKPKIHTYLIVHQNGNRERKKAYAFKYKYGKFVSILCLYNKHGKECFVTFNPISVEMLK